MSWKWSCFRFSWLRFQDFDQLCCWHRYTPACLLWSLDYWDIVMLNSMLGNVNILTWLLIGFRSHVRKYWKNTMFFSVIQAPAPWHWKERFPSTVTVSQSRFEHSRWDCLHWQSSVFSVTVRQSHWLFLAFNTSPVKGRKSNSLRPR